MLEEQAVVQYRKNKFNKFLTKSQDKMFPRKNREGSRIVFFFQCLPALYLPFYIQSAFVSSENCKHKENFKHLPKAQLMPV